MVTVRIKGGLGNQLFQYAAGYSLAKRLNQELVLDNSFYNQQSLRGYGLQYLNIDENSENKDKNPLGRIYKNKYINKALRIIGCSKLPLHEGTYLLEVRSDVMNEYFDVEKKNIYLDGYFQSQRYFENCRDEIRRQFTCSYEHTTEYQDILNGLRQVNSVAVHVRRGDLLKVKNDLNKNHYLLSAQYYHNAMKYIEEKQEDVVYYWFSDDLDWVMANFGNKDNYRFIKIRSEHADIDELMLMSECRHIISANSTFSWWASWLNSKDGSFHICPEKRYGNLQMIPDGWIKIPVN